MHAGCAGRGYLLQAVHLGFASTHVLSSLELTFKFPKKVCRGGYIGYYRVIGGIKRDARSLDYGS